MLSQENISGNSTRSGLSSICKSVSNLLRAYFADMAYFSDTPYFSAAAFILFRPVSKSLPINLSMLMNTLMSLPG